MATIINNRSTLATDPLRNFRFLVTFKPQDTTAGALKGLKDVTMGFTSVSGLAVATDSIPYREGGYNTTVHQIPGQTTFTPLSLQRGVILGHSQNWDWMRTLFATVAGGSNFTRKTNENFRVDLEIAVLSHPTAGAGSEDVAAASADPADATRTFTATSANTDHVAMKFHVYNAWPTTVAYSDLNAGDNALFVEQMALVHEGFDIQWAKSLTDTTLGTK